jgi:hypothetical protein
MGILKSKDLEHSTIIIIINYGIIVINAHYNYSV